MVAREGQIERFSEALSQFEDCLTRLEVRVSECAGRVPSLQSSMEARTKGNCLLNDLLGGLESAGEARERTDSDKAAAASREEPRGLRPGLAEWPYDADEVKVVKAEVVGTGSAGHNVVLMNVLRHFSGM